MKAEILNIKKRETSFDKKLNIYANGSDNLYPERVDRLINNSVTAKMSLKLMTQYLIGKGFGDADLFKINDEQNLYDLSCDLADDIAKHRGYAIHFDYNANFKPINPMLIPFERVRLGKKDSSDYNGKILTKNDWSDSKEEPIVYDVFNTKEEIVKKQIGVGKEDTLDVIADKLSKYKGQVLYFNIDRNYYYPLSVIDSVMNDCRSEELASIYKATILEKGFFGKQLIVTPPLIDNDEPEYIFDAEGKQIPNRLYHDKLTEAENAKKTIEKFMGAEQAGGAMMIELPDFEGKIEDIFQVINIESKLDDKMFEFTENSVSKNILMAFNNIPVSLVKSPDSALLGNSGEMLKQAKLMYWENCNLERNVLETIVNKLLSLNENWKGQYLIIKKLIDDTIINQSTSASI